MLCRIPLISFSSFCTFPDKMLSRLTSNVVGEIVVNLFQGCFILFIIIIINIPFQNCNFASGHIVFLQQIRFITLLWQNLKWYNIIGPVLTIDLNHRVDSRFAPSQWEMSLQSNTVSHWLGTNLESALNHMIYQGKSHLHLSCEMQFWEDTKPWHVLTRQAANVSGWKKHSQICFYMLATHWGWDKMAAIYQYTFLNAFSWLEMYTFRLRFHWSLFIRVQLIIFPALNQAMAWCRPGNKPLSEPMMVILPTHICVSLP